jgi:hypothetical protein
MHRAHCTCHYNEAMTLLWGGVRER